MVILPFDLSLVAGGRDSRNVFLDKSAVAEKFIKNSWYYIPNIRH